MIHARDAEVRLAPQRRAKAVNRLGMMGQKLDELVVGDDAIGSNIL